MLKQNSVYSVQPGDWTVDRRLDQMPSRGPWRAERPVFQWSGKKEERSRPWLLLGLNPAYTRAARGPSCLSKHWFLDEFPKSGTEQLFGLNRLCSVNHRLHITRAPCKYFSYRLEEHNFFWNPITSLLDLQMNYMLSLLLDWKWIMCYFYLLGSPML